jgi:chaperone required for assembly of F1-ATPase
MSNAWVMKRFWSTVSVLETEGGYTITLDDKPVRTPSRAPLIVPTRGLATWIATEWEAQTGKVDPRTMPATRTANSAIDKVMPQETEVADMLAGYGASDLLCYRADAPPALIARQSADWDPLLDWAAARFGARLATGPGIIPIAQDQAAIARLRDEVTRQSPFQLAAFHDLVALSGSLVLALAVTEGVRSADEAWTLSQLDEIWQEEQWGQDDEAMAAAAVKHAAFLHAARFHALTSQANSG